MFEVWKYRLWGSIPYVVVIMDIKYVYHTLETSDSSQINKFNIS